MVVPLSLDGKRTLKRFGFRFTHEFTYVNLLRIQKKIEQSGFKNKKVYCDIYLFF